MNFYEEKSEEKNNNFKPPKKIQFQVAADSGSVSGMKTENGRWFS
jgi:hypothetical protein